MATHVVRDVISPYPDAFKRMLYAIKMSGDGIHSSDINTGLIKFYTPVTAWSWGFKFDLQFSVPQQGVVRLEFIGHTRFGFDTFGTGGRVVETIMKNFMDPSWVTPQGTV